MTTTYTAEQIIAIGGTRWTGRNGTERVYLNDWAPLVGLDIEYYKSGNVRSAALDGRDLSNARASKLTTARVYWQDGTIHTDLRALADEVRVGESGAELTARLMRAIAARVAAAESTP